MFKLNFLKNYNWQKDPQYLILKVWLWTKKKSRRIGAWLPQGLATPLFSKKYTFYKQWAWQAPSNATPFCFKYLIVHYQGFQMRYCKSLQHTQFLRKLKKTKIGYRAVQIHMSVTVSNIEYSIILVYLWVSRVLNSLVSAENQLTARRHNHYSHTVRKILP